MAVAAAGDVPAMLLLARGVPVRAGTAVGCVAGASTLFGGAWPLAVADGVGADPSSSPQPARATRPTARTRGSRFTEVGSRRLPKYYAGICARRNGSKAAGTSGYAFVRRTTHRGGGRLRRAAGARLLPGGASALGRTGDRRGHRGRSVGARDRARRHVDIGDRGDRVGLPALPCRSGDRLRATARACPQAEPGRIRVLVPGSPSWSASA